MSLNLPIGTAPKSRGKIGAIIGQGCLFLFALPFAGFGLFALASAPGKFRNGEHDAGMLVLFGLIFCAIGFGLMIAAVFAGRWLKKRSQLQAQHPGEPWRWREDWASGLIQSTDRATVLGAWIFALFWNGVSSFVFFVVPQELAKGNKGVIIALIFPVIGVTLLVWAVRATIRWRKFGQSVFKMISVPGVIGGGLAGGIQIPHKLHASEGVRVRLVCLQRVTTGSGKNRSTTENVLWEDEKVITKDPVSDPRHTVVPVFFQIPPGWPATDSEGNQTIVWRLEAKAKVPGVDYSAQFEVPVFVTEKSRTSAEPLPDLTQQFQAPAASWQPPPSRIRVTNTPTGGVEIYFPPARNAGTVFFLTVFLIIWSGSIWFMIYQKAPVLFPIVFGFFEAIILFVWFSMVCKSTRVTADASTLTLTHHWLGFGTPRRWPASEVAGIELSIGMRSGSTAYYDLQVQPRVGAKQNAGGAIPDKRHAEWLAQKLRAALKTS